MMFEVITDAVTGEVNIRKFTDKEIKAMQPSDADIESAARSQRNAMLAASDWTQVIDTPVDINAWARYRQQLRDISKQAGFPKDIDWPTEPARG